MRSRRRVSDPQDSVPWSGFDLINALNAWKRSEAAGRSFVVAPNGTITKQVNGLAWRGEVSAQVFEEAAVDLGRALSAYKLGRVARVKGHRMGFPRRKRKGHCRESFRLRNKVRQRRRLLDSGRGRPSPLGDPAQDRHVRVHDDTRRLRRLLRPVAADKLDTGKLVMAPRARILFATCRRHGARWHISLNIEAPDFHPHRRHPSRLANDHAGFVGVDRGLSAFAVAATATRTEVGRFDAAQAAPAQHACA